MNPKILLVDDEENILKQMRWALESDYQVFTSSVEGEATNIFENEKPPVVTLDLSLNPHNLADLGGMRLLEQILSEEPTTRAIVVTGNDDDQNALRAVRLVAFDYYAKPVRLQELKVMIKRAFHIHDASEDVDVTTSNDDVEDALGPVGSLRRDDGSRGHLRHDRAAGAQPGPGVYQRRIGQRQGAGRAPHSFE